MNIKQKVPNTTCCSKSIDKARCAITATTQGIRYYTIIYTTGNKKSRTLATTLAVALSIILTLNDAKVLLYFHLTKFLCNFFAFSPDKNKIPLYYKVVQGKKMFIDLQ